MQGEGKRLEGVALASLKLFHGNVESFGERRGRVLAVSNRIALESFANMPVDGEAQVARPELVPLAPHGFRQVIEDMSLGQSSEIARRSAMGLVGGDLFFFSIAERGEV